MRVSMESLLLTTTSLYIILSLFRWILYLLGPFNPIKLTSCPNRGLIASRSDRALFWKLLLCVLVTHI